MAPPTHAQKHPMKPTARKFSHYPSCLATPRKSEKWKKALSKEPNTTTAINNAIYHMEQAILSGRTDEARMGIFRALGKRLRHLAALNRFNPDLCDDPDLWVRQVESGLIPQSKLDFGTLSPRSMGEPKVNGDGSPVGADNVFGARDPRVPSS